MFVDPTVPSYCQIGTDLGTHETTRDSSRRACTVNQSGVTTLQSHRQSLEQICDLLIIIIIIIRRDDDDDDDYDDETSLRRNNRMNSARLKTFKNDGPSHMLRRLFITVLRPIMSHSSKCRKPVQK